MRVEWLITLVLLSFVFVCAIKSYCKCTTLTRDMEAVSFLSTIAAKQEQHWSRHGTYVDTDPNPTTEPRKTQKRPWVPGVNGWAALGAKPRGTHVSFQYQTRSGGPDDLCVPPEDMPSACSKKMKGRAWFWAVARSEAFFVIFNSERPQPWVFER